MKFLLQRNYPKENYTIGDFFVDYEDGQGPHLLFNVLEDKIRDLNKDGDLDEPGEQKYMVKQQFLLAPIKL